MTGSSRTGGETPRGTTPPVPPDAHPHAADRDSALLDAMTSRQPDPEGGGEFQRRRKSRPTVSVVIPTLNEGPNLEFVLPRISPWIDEVVIVDGSSTDRTLDVARELLPEIQIVRQTGRGKGDALRAGFAAARGDLIIMLDADGSMDPREIPAFVGALASGRRLRQGHALRAGRREPPTSPTCGAPGTTRSS